MSITELSSEQKAELLAIADPHSLVREAVAKLVKLKPGRFAKYGDVRFRDRSLEILDIFVTEEQVARALRVFDAVIRASIIDGCEWMIREGETVATCFGVALKVRIQERTRREPVLKKTSPFDPDNRLVGTGELTFFINEMFLNGTQVRWADSRSTVIEDRITDIVKGMREAARAVKAREDERAEISAKIRAGALERAQREKLAKAEAERKALLRSASIRLDEAESLRRLHERVAEVTGSMREGDLERVREMLAFVEKYADDIDPTRDPAALAKEFHQI